MAGNEEDDNKSGSGRYLTWIKAPAKSGLRGFEVHCSASTDVRARLRSLVPVSNWLAVFSYEWSVEESWKVYVFSSS